MRFVPLVLLAVVMVSAAVRADDLADSPAAAADRAADIESVFFFLDPSDSTYAVAAVTFGGQITPALNANLGFFDSGVKFVFNFENTGDANIDRVIEVTHTAQTSRTLQQTASIKLPPRPAFPSGRTFTALTTISRAAFGPQGAPTFGGGTSAQQTPTVTTDGLSGVSYFGGLIDDPFYFDQPSELAYRNSRFVGQTNPAILTRGRDAFAGYNTMVVSLRIPVTLIKGAGNEVGLAVYTQREHSVEPAKKKPKKGEPTTAFGNVDRMGHPFVNNIFTSYANKNAYNAATPTNDAAGQFAGDMVATMQALQTSQPFINILSSLFITRGDLLRLNVSIPNTGTEGGKNPEAAYPNGRRPNDDVIDTLLTLINNGVFQGDAVNDNELPMRDAFPFFAQPHMPFPPGAGSEDLTRN